MRIYQVSVSYRTEESKWRKNKLWIVATTDLVRAIHLAKQEFRKELDVEIWDVNHKGPLNYIDPDILSVDAPE